MEMLELLFLVLFVILLVGFILLAKRGVLILLRDLPAFRHLQTAVGMAVEEGKRIHVALGRGNLLSENFASGLIGLSVLERLARVAVVGDRPPVATSGEGGLMLLSQDTLKGAYRSMGIVEESLLSQGQMTGVTPFSYAMGVQPLLSDENVSVDLLLGSMGKEAGLICDASYRQRNLRIGGSDDLGAQAVYYAAASHPLIGEELFAAGAYLDCGAAHRASLQAQDILRWGIAIVLILGALAKIAGIL